MGFPPSGPSGYTGTASHYFPDIGAPEAELLAYRDRLINPWSIFRNQHVGRAGLAISYFLGRQWAELDTSIAFQGVRGAFIREMSDDETGMSVRPVDNIIDPGVEAEVIALVKRGWTPKVAALSNDPQMKAAAQYAHDRLNSLLERQHWPEKRHILGLNFALSGTGLMYTACDKSFRNLKAVPAPDAVRCSNPDCGTRLYSPAVPVEMLEQGVPQDDGSYAPTAHLETARDVMPDETQLDIQEAELGYCPTCPEPYPLEPYTPTLDEAESGLDVFGRPLGVDSPKADPIVEIDDVFEFYPQNGGAYVTPDTMRRYGRRKVREMEWVEERYPHLIDSLGPEPYINLVYGDPLFGGGSDFTAWSAVLDAGVLDHHLNIDEVVELPSFRHPDGRYVVCAKDVVLEDGPLLEKVTRPNDKGESEELTVPRVLVSASRFKLRPKVFWGTGIADHEIPKQNRLNGLDAQIITTRLQNGYHISMPEDMWPDDGPTAELDGQGFGHMLRFKPSTSNPAVTEPRVYGGVTFQADGWMPERQAILTSNEKSMSSSPLTTGGAPGKGVGTTSGIQLLIEQDEKSRSLREDELVNSVQFGWSHLLQIDWVLKADDEDEYRRDGPDDTYKLEQYKGKMLRGQTETKIERAPFIAKSILQREGAREGLADHVIEIDGPVTRRRLKEIYGIDTNLNEQESNQVDHAERMWGDFEDKAIVRVLDPIDDPIIHYEVLGAHLRTDKSERMADDCEWDKILGAISGWEDNYRALITQEAASVAFYGEGLTEQTAPEAYAKAVAAYQAQKASYGQQVQLQQQMAEAAGEAEADPVTGVKPAPPAPLPLTPPQMPPQPIVLPKLVQERVWMVWTGMMKLAGIELENDGPDAETAPDLTLYPKMRALVTAYKLAIAMMAPAAPPAPGSGATTLAADKGAPPSPPPTAPLPGGGAT